VLSVVLFPLARSDRKFSRIESLVSCFLEIRNRSEFAEEEAESCIVSIPYAEGLRFGVISRSFTVRVDRRSAEDGTNIDEFAEVAPQLSIADDSPEGKLSRSEVSNGFG
jgi:hypothetical protein